MTFLARTASLATVAVAAFLAACGGGGGDSGSSPLPAGTSTGIFKVALTDAPACGYERVDVTIQKIRLHPSSTAAETDAGWSEVVLNPAQRIDLLSLSNGVLVDLGQTTLPTGKYTQLRLQLAANDAANPLANAVTPSSTGVQTALATPSASQAGLKLNVDIDIAANQVADFILDFDACKSVVRLGQSGNYNLKPVIALIPRVNDAGMRVIGYVSSALNAATTQVSVQSGGDVVKSTPPDSTGRFTLYPVPAGTYDLVVNAVGRVPATVTNVPVSNTAHTNVNTAAAPIDPPSAGTLRTAAGTVTTGTTPVDAVIEVIKKYTGGPNVVVATAPVDGSTGSFAYTLNSSAPVRAAYSPTTAPLVFSPDPAAPAGRYTVAAKVGASTKTVDIDLTTGDATNLAFTFP
jgi:hypothetical protein